MVMDGNRCVSVSRLAFTFRLVGGVLWLPRSAVAPACPHFHLTAAISATLTNATTSIGDDVSDPLPVTTTTYNSPCSPPCAPPPPPPAASSPPPASSAETPPTLKQKPRV